MEIENGEESSNSFMGDCQWKTPILAPHSSETPKPISIKFETDNYVCDAIPREKFGFCTFSGGVFLYR